MKRSTSSTAWSNVTSSTLTPKRSKLLKWAMLSSEPASSRRRRVERSHDYGGGALSVLITGLGYIGAKLAEELLEAGESVVALENFFCTPRAALAQLARRPGLTLVEGSINHPATLRKAFQSARVHALLHLAAQPSAHPLAATPRHPELTNLVGTRLVLD